MSIVYLISFWIIFAGLESIKSDYEQRRLKKDEWAYHAFLACIKLNYDGYIPVDDQYQLDLVRFIKFD